MVLNNRDRLHRELAINPSEIVMANPYFQRKTNTTPGCQIDYLVQTKFNTLYVCEIKSVKHPLGPDIIQEMTQRCERLKVPKNFTVRPVLLHMNGITESVREQEYFSHLIDIKDFLHEDRAQ
ncbi:MAG: hypothetical protein CMF50_06500 [Legionellales bacterium]|nr:hypothetical protein [Legionellales bacterium]